MEDEWCEFCGCLISEHLDEKPCPDDDAVCGRTLEVVSEYASTCDECGELTSHELMTMDNKTQLGYCDQCMEKLDLRIMVEQDNELEKLTVKQ